jgi:type II secretory pathway component PulF
MSIYRYVAKKDPQNTQEGSIEALSEKDAIEKISLMGLIPVKIEQESKAYQPTAVSAFKAAGRLRSREITIFSRQLASLLKAGVPILRSISIISDQSENNYLKAILNHIRKEVEDGAVFSSVLSQYPRIFSPLYISMVKAGEDSGALAEVLSRISDYRAKQEDMIARFRMALVYPILMAVVGIGTVIFMFTFVMPRLTRLYTDMGQDLPIATKILISTSRALQQWWVIFLFAALFLVLLFNRWSRTKAGKIAMSGLKLHIPVVKNLVLKLELARFSRTLELLLRSGIPILRSLNITIPVLGNEIIRKQFQDSSKNLEQGGSLGRSLKNSKVIPLFMSNLLTVGEETGNLDDALTELASSYESDTDEALRVMTSLLEPLLILAMGLVVGFIVVAMLLPIFEINVMVR